MKVAVLISGLCHSKAPQTNVKRNIERIRRFFPSSDFFFATYTQFKDTFEENFPEEKCLFVDEPKIDYHPYSIDKQHWESNRYLETKQFIMRSPERTKWAGHHTKQHLIHSYLCDTIDIKQYDVIVRARFDTWIWDKADFGPFIKSTHTNQTINAFAATKWQKHFEKIREFDSKPGGRHHNWLLDQLIIYPSSFLDTSYVYKLHEEKRLHPAEMGWYQILSRPNGSKHKCWDGWVNHDKHILTKYFKG